MTESEQLKQKEIFLETFFKFLSSFSFEKAKEIVDKELGQQPPPRWGSLVQVLGILNAAERDYASLSMLGHTSAGKLFGKKEVKSIRHAFSSILSDLEKVQFYVEGSYKALPILETTYGSHDKMAFSMQQSEDQDILQFILHLCSQLKVFIAARMSTSMVHEKAYTSALSKDICYEDLHSAITDLIQTHQKDFHHPVLSCVQSSFMLECEVMAHLLEAQIEMQSFHFLKVVMALFKAHTKFNAWAGGISTKEVKTGFFSRISKSQAPALLMWISKLKTAMTAKVSLYFYEALTTHQTINPDLRMAMSKCKPDLYGKVVQFHRKTEALSSSLVYCTNGEPFQDIGYNLPTGHGEPRTGLDSYPAVFSYPSTRAEKHWPAVVSLITGFQREPVHLGKIYHCYDEKMSSTYFLTQTDPKVTFVVIYECKKSEKDSHAQNYLTEMISHLLLTKAWTSLSG